MNDLELSNRKAGQENSDLARQLEEVDQHVSLLHKLRHQLNSQLEDLKKSYEEEARERQSLLGRYRNLRSAEWDNMNTITIIEEGKGRGCCLGDRSYSIPCRASNFAPRRFDE